LIEARMAKRGKREFVQILRLLEIFRPEDVLAGIREAIARGTIRNFVRRLGMIGAKELDNAATQGTSHT
jgi:hypothetical protein